MNKNIISRKELDDLISKTDYVDKENYKSKLDKDLLLYFSKMRVKYISATDEFEEDKKSFKYYIDTSIDIVLLLINKEYDILQLSRNKSIVDCEFNDALFYDELFYDGKLWVMLKDSNNKYNVLISGLTHYCISSCMNLEHLYNFEDSSLINILYYTLHNYFANNVIIDKYFG